MRFLFLTSLLIAAAIPAMAAETTATARLIDIKGNALGEVKLTESPHGVLIDVMAHDLNAGAHGLHFHSIGTCDDGDDGFKASQGHIKGSGKEHGLLNAQGPEAGDLPNLYANDDGDARAQFFSTMVSLTGVKGRENLLDKDGSTIVIHANGDDHKTQPIGGAGDRVACGVIKAD